MCAALFNPRTAIAIPPSEEGTSAGVVFAKTALPLSENDSSDVSNAFCALAAVPSALTSK